jgi:hypothetical protein
VEELLEQMQVPDIPPTQAELRDVVLGGFPLGLSVASSVITKTRNPYFEPNDPTIRPLVESAMKSGTQLYHYALRRISETKPDLVIAFNGRFVLSSAIYHAARDTGVAWALHERSQDAQSFTLRLERTPHDLGEAHLRAWEEARSSPLHLVRARRSAIEELRKAHAHAASRDYWTDWSEEFHPPGTPGRWLAYFNSSLSEYAAVAEDRFAPWGGEIEAVEALAQEASDLGWGVVLRLHPNLTNMHPSETEAWLDRFSERDEVLIVAPESRISSYSILRHVSLVVTGWSTIGREALLTGLPVACVARSEWQEVAALPRVTDAAGFRELLRSPLRAHTFDDALRALLAPVEASSVRFRHFAPTGEKTGRFKGIDIDPKGRTRDPSRLRRRAFIRGPRAAWRRLASLARWDRSGPAVLP